MDIFTNVKDFIYKLNLDSSLLYIMVIIELKKPPLGGFIFFIKHE